MIASWVDRNTCSEYETELKISSGTGFKAIAMRKRSSEASSSETQEEPKNQEDARLSQRNSSGQGRVSPSDLVSKRRCIYERNTSLFCDLNRWPSFSGSPAALQHARDGILSLSFSALEFSADDLTVLIGELFQLVSNTFHFKLTACTQFAYFTRSSPSNVHAISVMWQYDKTRYGHFRLTWKEKKTLLPSTFSKVPCQTPQTPRARLCSWTWTGCCASRWRRHGASSCPPARACRRPTPTTTGPTSPT